MSAPATPWSWRALGVAALTAGLLLAVGLKLKGVLAPDHDPESSTLLPTNPGNALVAIGILSVLSFVALASTLALSRGVFGGRQFFPLLAVGPAIMLGWDALRHEPVEWSTTAIIIVAFLLAGGVYRYLSLRLHQPAPMS